MSVRSSAGVGADSHSPTAAQLAQTNLLLITPAELLTDITPTPVGILQCFALYCFAYGRPRETHSGTVTDEVAIALCITVLHLFSCMLSAMRVLVLILLTRYTA